MLILYIANKNYSSWSLRPWVLLKELGVAFEERLVRFGTNKGVFQEDFEQASPTGCVPCLVDGELMVWDSLAIVEYVAEKHPGVWPADDARRAWARSASAEMHSGFRALRNKMTMNCGLRIRVDAPAADLARDLNRVDALWQDGLARFGGPFLAGDRFTAVDAFFAPVAFRIQTYEPQMSSAALAYARLLLSLPSMQAWYEAGLAERFRDEEHEQEAREAGRWLEDLRAPAQAED
ncbi:glutathione S-transferase family protein [Roseateles sp. NT4]|uniref:glutathione S-transferase family protein n=1 Tax=Roseateles sp. NT4 TaxID=3453715 RepID=UPI003EEE33FE